MTPDDRYHFEPLIGLIESAIERGESVGQYHHSEVLRLLRAALARPAEPAEGLREMAIDALDLRTPPPGHAAFREPKMSAAEWRAAYFALAQIAQEQLDKCRALAATPAPDSGGEERLRSSRLDLHELGRWLLKHEHHTVHFGREHGGTVALRCGSCVGAANFRWAAS